MKVINTPFFRVAVCLIFSCVLQASQVVKVQPALNCTKRRAKIVPVDLETLAQTPDELVVSRTKEGAFILDPKQPIICDRKRLICSSIKHPNKHAYYCAQCDEACPLCVKRCKNETCITSGKPLKTCFSHDEGPVSYCRSCDKECPQCTHAEQDEKLVDCVICMDYARPQDHRDWVQLKCNGGKGHPNEAICSNCVINQQVNNDGTCFICRDEINYDACSLCNKYLGPKHKKVTYYCLGHYHWANGDYNVKHTLCVGCGYLTLENSYINEKGKKVVRCLCKHASRSRGGYALRWWYDFEVPLDKIRLPKGHNLGEIVPEEKSGVMEKGMCDHCHKPLDKASPISWICKDEKNTVTHTLHNKCAEKMAEAIAVRKNGVIGMYCPYSHGTRYDYPATSDRLVDLGYFDGLALPKRFTAICYLCKGHKGDIEDLRDERVTGFDCFDDRGVKYRHYYHWQCLLDYAAHRTTQEKEASYIFWTREVKKIPCPYHAGTEKHHLVELPDSFPEVKPGEKPCDFEEFLTPVKGAK